MAKQEISAEEAKATLEMISMAKPENAREAELKAAISAKMKAILVEAEKEKARKAQEAGLKKVEMIAKAINECCDKYKCDIVLAKDELGVTCLAVYDEESGVSTLL